MTDSIRTTPVALATAILTLCSIGASHTASARDCDADVIANNVRVARLVYEEVLSKGRIDENEGLYHANFVAHGVARDAGRAEDRAATEGWRNAIPDLRMEVLRTVADCDSVAVHWSGSGTNTGSGNGIPVTGKHLENLWGMTIFRMENGKIREEWTSFNEYPMLEQLGLLPGPDPAQGKRE